MSAFHPLRTLARSDVDRAFVRCGPDRVRPSNFYMLSVIGDPASGDAERHFGPGANHPRIPLRAQIAKSFATPPLFRDGSRTRQRRR